MFFFTVFIVFILAPDGAKVQHVQIWNTAALIAEESNADLLS